MNCSPHWRKPFPALAVESVLMGGLGTCAACGASVGRGKEGGTKAPAGPAAWLSYSVPSCLCVCSYLHENPHKAALLGGDTGQSQVVFGN